MAFNHVYFNLRNILYVIFFDTSLDLADVLYACLKLYGIIELQTGSYRAKIITIKNR